MKAKEMQGKYIEDKYAIDIIVDDIFLYLYCKCGCHTVAKISYCPMCGRKLKEQKEDVED